MEKFKKDLQYYKFCLYGFLKNLKFFDAFIILFFREMGFSFLKIGFLFSIREVATNIFEIPTGIIADAMGRRKSMIFAFIAYIFSFLVFYFLPNYYLYIGAMVLFAAGEAFRTGTHKAMIMEYLRMKNMSDVKVYYYGSTRACSQFGSAISSLIAAALVFWAGNYRIVFISSVIPYIFGLLLMISYPKELDGEIIPAKGKGHLARFYIRAKETVRDFVQMFKDPHVLKAMFNSSLFDAYFKSVKDYLQPILKSFVIAAPILLFLNTEKRIAVLVGFVYFLLYLLTTMASKNAGKFESLFKSRPASLNITYLIGAGLIFVSGLLYIQDLYVVVIVFFVLYYMLQNVRRPMTVAYVSDLISTKVMATGLSSESQIKTILIAILSPVIGFLVDRFGIGAALMILSGISFVTYFFISISKTQNIQTT